jgi:hypothetical protein
MRTGRCGLVALDCGRVGSPNKRHVTSRHVTSVVAPGLARERQGRKDGSVKERVAAGGSPSLLIPCTIFSRHVVGFTSSRDCIGVAYVRDRGHLLRFR